MNASDSSGWPVADFFLLAALFCVVRAGPQKRLFQNKCCWSSVGIYMVYLCVYLIIIIKRRLISRRNMPGDITRAPTSQKCYVDNIQNKFHGAIGTGSRMASEQNRTQSVYAAKGNVTINKKPNYRRGTARCVVSVEIRQLPRNSAETTCTTRPEQIEVMKLKRYSKATCNKHVHSTMTRSSRFRCPVGVINEPTTVELWISPVYRRLAVAKFSKSTMYSRNCSRDPDHAHLRNTHHKTKTSHGRLAYKI